MKKRRQKSTNGGGGDGNNKGEETTSGPARLGVSRCVCFRLRREDFGGNVPTGHVCNNYCITPRLHDDLWLFYLFYLLIYYFGADTFCQQ